VSEDVKASQSTDAALKMLEDDTKLNIPPSEVIRRLRERGEPIKLFGETERDSLRRLRKLEIEAPDIEKGLRNDMKAAMDQVDQEYLSEIIKGQTDQGKHDVKFVEDEVKTFKDITDMDAELGKGNVGRDCEIVLSFLNFLIQKWAVELNARPEDVKRSAQGKFVSATYSQTIDYLRPLTGKLKNKTIPSDIRDHLVNITKCMIERDYIQAHNHYMEMAIGNAPWPVGVTASGIHKRPGTEKLYTRNVAHVLNDETQRKYIQALKRLMTKCQQYFTTDPSRCFEFVPPRKTDSPKPS